MKIFKIEEPKKMGEQRKESRYSKVAKSAMLLSVCSIVSVLIAFIKEAIIARYYGVSALADSYNLSVEMPRVVFTFISMAISTVVIPVYTRTMVESGKEKSSFFFCNFTSMVLLSYLALVLFGELFAYYIVKIFAPGLENHTAQLTMDLFRMTCPAIGLGLFCKINTGVLNSHNIFLLPSLIPILFNLAVGGCIIAFSDRCGIFAATIGTIAGMTLEFIFTGYLRKKYVSYKPVLDLRDQDTISALKMAVPVFIGMSATEINLIVDKVVASHFEAGSISALNYTSKLSSGISTLFIASIITVIFPELTMRVVNGEAKKATETYLFSIKSFILLLLPIVAGGIFLSEEIIVLIYKRGAFDALAVSTSTPIFIYYFIGLFFSGLRQVGMNFIYAYGDSKTPMRNTAVGTFINIGLDIILSKIMGVAGLALATTSAGTVIGILLMRSSKDKNRYIYYNKCFPLLLKSGIASCLMLYAIWLLKKFLMSGGFYNINNEKNIFIFTGGAVLIGACVYFVTLLMLKTEELFYVLKLFRKG